MALEIITAKTFSNEIVCMAEQLNVTYWEALNTLVKDKDIESERIPRLLTKDILSKVTADVEALRLVK